MLLRCNRLSRYRYNYRRKFIVLARLLLVLVFVFYANRAGLLFVVSFLFSAVFDR